MAKESDMAQRGAAALFADARCTQPDAQIEQQKAGQLAEATVWWTCGHQWGVKYGRKSERSPQVLEEFLSAISLSICGILDFHPKRPSGVIKSASMLRNDALRID